MEAATEDYPEVQDLLKRFTTLKDANKNLNEAQTRDEGETERLRSEFSSYTKERYAGEEYEIQGIILYLGKYQAMGPLLLLLLLLSLPSDNVFRITIW